MSQHLPPESPGLAASLPVPDLQEREQPPTPPAPIVQTKRQAKKAPKAPRTPKARTPKPVVVKEMAWTSITPQDIERAEQGFTHYTSKTVHSAVGEATCRLALGEVRPELPYVALKVLGGRLEELDFVEGGAAAVRKPRQIRDKVSGKSSGIQWTGVPEDQEALLNPEGDVARRLAAPREGFPDHVPSLLRQVIVPAPDGGEWCLTPIGAVGLNSKILERFEQTRASRLAQDPKDDRMFWGRAANNLGGAKPQNIGLVCAVAGGPKAAGFAWFFPAPKFPTVRLKRRFAVLFRRFRLSLSSAQVADWRRVLEGLQVNALDFDSRAVLEQACDALAIQVYAQAQRWQSLLQEQLAWDWAASQDAAPEEGPPPAAQWEGLWHSEAGRVRLPEKNQAAWTSLRAQPPLSRGWINPSQRDMAWYGLAAQQMAHEILAQTGQIVSSDVQFALEKHLLRSLKP